MSKGSGLQDGLSLTCRQCFARRLGPVHGATPALVRSLGGMPAHEVGKRLELARRFDHPQTRYPLCHFRQGARDGEHQVGLRNRQDCRNKERNSERDMTL